jgi:hypothetical protein
MTTNPYEFPSDSGPMDQAGEGLAAMRLGEIQVGAALGGMGTDQASGLQHELLRRASPVWPRAMRYGWTPAHSEAARFVGECFAVGALLGLATEVARPVWEQRHG